MQGSSKFSSSLMATLYQYPFMSDGNQAASHLQTLTVNKYIHQSISKRTVLTEYN